MGELKQQSIQGIKWSAIERFSIQGISFLIGIILARLLTPEDYGIIGMIGVFTAIIGSFVDSGFSSALIRKINRTEADCSTTFYFNLAMAFVCYAIMFVCSPYIADFFHTPILKDIIKVICLDIVINAFGAVQSARFSWNVDFKSTAKASICSTIISGIIGITMAYTGWGVWALVGQSLSAAIVNVCILWYLSTWHPKLIFSVASFKELFSFGSKLLASGMLHTLYSQLDTMLIGRYFNSTQLGLWSRGKHIVSYPSTNITSILQRVTFPILAKIQNDDIRLISAYRQYIKLASMIIFFLMMQLFSLGKPLMLFLLTDKWAEAIIFMQIFCFTMMFDHINAININLLYVKGRSDLVLKLEVIKKTISISILIACIPLGLKALALGMVAYCQIAIIFNTYYTGKMFNFGYFKQLKDYMGYFLVSAIACLPSFIMCTLLDWPYLLLLFIGGSISTVLYTAILYIKKDEMFIKYVIDAISTKIKQLHHK